MSGRDTIVNLEETPLTPQTPGSAERPSISVFRKRLRKFRTIKRGYYSFLILLCAYGVSFLLPMLINNEALLVRYDSKFYFPLIHYYPASAFGQQRIGEPDYRDVARVFRQENKGNWAVLPHIRTALRSPSWIFRAALRMRLRGSTSSAPMIAAGIFSRGWPTDSMFRFRLRFWF